MSLLDSIRINKTGKVVDKTQAAIHEAETSGGSGVSPVSFDIEKYQAQIVNIEKHNLQTVPRETVLNMLKNVPLDEDYSFKVAAGEGDHYIQAMRQVLSRARKKARRGKIMLDEFKLLVKKIDTVEGEYDEIILVRTKNMTPHEVSVYDDILKEFTKS